VVAAAPNADRVVDVAGGTVVPSLPAPPVPRLTP